MTGEQEQQFRRVLAGWKDDSDEPFSTKGMQISWNLQAIERRCCVEKREGYRAQHGGRGARLGVLPLLP